MRYKLSFTDTAIMSFFGGIYMGVVGIALGVGGSILIESIDKKINPRTAEYLATKKKKQLNSWIKDEKEKIEEKEKEIKFYDKYKESLYQNQDICNIKKGIEYRKEYISRYEKEIEEIDSAFILKESVPLMPEEMGYRKMFFEMI